MSIKSILMVGVGGQGIVLASNVLCTAAMLAGNDVKKSEIHGMAQRGGSVVSHVRYGKKVYSPSIPTFCADYLVSFERMEYLRYLNYANPNTTLLLGSKKILPPTVALGKDIYPDSAIEEGKNKFKQAIEVDADKLAQEVGNIKTAGTVILGLLSKQLDISDEFWEEAIKKSIPPKLIEVNINAFEAGKRSI